MPRKYLLRLPILLTLYVFASPLFAQNEPAIQQYISEGIARNTNKQYELALEQFNKALLLNPKHDQANYLMASTYYKLDMFTQCILHCDKAINLMSAYEEEAYMLKGKAFISNGQFTEAIHNYNKMLSEYPDNYEAYYDMAYAYYQQNDFANAEYNLSNALSIKPTHAESHLLLGNIMIKQGESLKAVMALSNFLLLEPRGARAAEVYIKLQKQMPKAFGDISDLSNLSLATDASTNQFASADVMLAIFDGEKNQAPDGRVYAQSTQMLLDKLTVLKKESTFWWNFYVNFYNDLNYDKHLETLSYYISQSQNLEETALWLAENRSKVSQMIDWVNGYDR